MSHYKTKVPLPPQTAGGGGSKENITVVDGTTDIDNLTNLAVTCGFLLKLSHSIIGWFFLLYYGSCRLLYVRLLVWETLMHKLIILWQYIDLCF